MPILRVTGIEKRYGGVHALKGIDLSLSSGEVHALLGENGAGKSTLIKVLSGLVLPDAGRLEVDGVSRQPRSSAQAHAIGIQTVHQELELAEPLSIAENIFMGCQPGRVGLVDRTRMREDTRRILQRIGATLDPDTRVGDLSISDRQIVEITRALVRNGQFVILDEPTAALPPREVDRLMEVIGRLKAEGVGILYVSHRLEEVIRIADRVTVLRDGQVVAEIAREDINKDTLVRHILGRDLAAFSAPRNAPTGEIDVECEGLESGKTLKGLNFQVRRGEVLGFFGLLGAGQESIGDLLFGLREGSCKRCVIGGRPGLPRSPRAALTREFGYVPADRKETGLVTRLSIVENLMLPDFGAVTRYGVFNWRRAESRANELIRQYNIRCSSGRQLVGELSGGNQQKVAVAKWAVRGVKRLFFDEPTRGVDVGAKVEIYRFIKQYAAKGGCCMVSSSDPAEIASIADRVVILKDGVAVNVLESHQIQEASLVAAAL